MLLLLICIQISWSFTGFVSGGGSWVGREGKALEQEISCLGYRSCMRIYVYPLMNRFCRDINRYRSELSHFLEFIYIQAHSLLYKTRSSFNYFMSSLFSILIHSRFCHPQSSFFLFWKNIIYNDSLWMKQGISYLNKSTMYDLKLYAGGYVNP